MKTKKIIFSCIAVIILMFTFCINAFAVVEPVSPVQLMYTMPVKANGTNSNYAVWSVKSIIKTIPENLRNNGLLTTYVKDYRQNLSVKEPVYLNLYDGSKLYLSASSRPFGASVNYITYPFNNFKLGTWHELPEVAEKRDIILIFDQTCKLKLYYYDYITGDIKSAIDVSFLYNTVFPVNATPDKVYDNGYNDGFKKGQATNGKFTEEDLKKAREEGFTDGYNTSANTVAIIDNSLSGFFSAVGGFFDTFMGIGIGNLTVASLLGLALVACVIMIIVKIVRG